MQRVINLAFLLSLLLLTLDGIAYGNTVSCTTNFFDKANVPTSGVGFLPELSVDGIVMTDKNLPNNPAVDVSARINVAPSDVGQFGEIIFVARYNGNYYMKTPQGWKSWDLLLKNLIATGAPRKLAAIEDLDIETQLTLPGDFDVYVGYCRAQGSMQYSDALTFRLLSPSKPDLSVTLLTIGPKSVSSSGALVLSATVSNGGDAAAAASVLRYYRSADAIIDRSDVNVCSVTIPALSSASKSTKGCQITPPASGTYYYGACVDSIADESNIGNNCSAGAVFSASSVQQTCALPQVLQGGVCVTPAQTCTAPQVLQGDVCVTMAPACVAPQVLQGDSCVTPVLTCTSPQVLQSGVCVTPTNTPQTSTTIKLNDTGISSDQCYSTGASTLIGCVMELAKNLNLFQDGMSGRDVSNNNDSDGHAGFSFTKMCNSGELAGQGSCPASPSIGSAANTWGCTKDNVTGLIWEVKTDDGGVHDKNALYYNYTSAYNPDRLYATEVDANGFVKAINTAGFCGGSDWRLPTVDELLSIVDYSVASPGPAVDAAFFPNTAQKPYWSSLSYSAFGGIDNAWRVDFSNGSVSSSCRGCLNGVVRLVRVAK